MALVKYNNNSISSITAASSLPTGAMTLIKSQTASSSSTISFVDGTSDVVLDSTYPIYLFKFINCHPQTDGKGLQFNVSIDSGSNYNVAKTSTHFRSYHYENDSDAGIGYVAAHDLAQGTGFQDLTEGGISNDNDGCLSGSLQIFSPSSTTFVKHFIGTFSIMKGAGGGLLVNSYVAGYANTASAVNAVQFKMDSGNIDAGTIKLYGIKDS